VERKGTNTGQRLSAYGERKEKREEMGGKDITITLRIVIIKGNISVVRKRKRERGIATFTGEKHKF